MAETMTALRKTRGEAGAELCQIPVPEPAGNQVLVKVEATSICGTDLSLYNWNEWARSRIKDDELPRTLGHEFAGEVLQVGDCVSRIKVGDFVSAETHIPCFNCPACLNRQFHICGNLKILSLDTEGCFAQYALVPEVVCWVNERTIPPEIACLQEPLGNAVYCALVEPVTGKTVLILGDGPTGLLATAVCKVAGAAYVATVGQQKYRLEIARQFGADRTINQAEVGDEGVEERVRQDLEKFYEGRYGVDVVLEMVGAEETVNMALNLVRKGGRISAFGITKKLKIEMNYNDGIVFKGVDIRGINGRIMFDTWYLMKNLLTSGKLDIAPILTHKMPLAEFEEGFRLMNDWPRQCGKVVFLPWG